MTDPKHPLTDDLILENFTPDYEGGCYLCGQICVGFNDDHLRAAYDIGSAEGSADMLQKVIEWLRSMNQYPYMYMWDNAPELEKDDLINDLKKAMRPQQQEDN